MSGERGRFAPPETAPRRRGRGRGHVFGCGGGVGHGAAARGFAGAGAEGAGRLWRAGAARGGVWGARLSAHDEPKSALKWGSGAHPARAQERRSEASARAADTPNAEARAQRAGTSPLDRFCEPLCAYLTARGSPVGQHASKQNRDDGLSRHRSALGCPTPQESSPLSSCVS